MGRIPGRRGPAGWLGIPGPPGPRIVGWPGRTGALKIGCPGAGERAGAPGLGVTGAGGPEGGRTCVCCLNRWTISGRGGTTGRAAGCPANDGRGVEGRGAMGAPGVRDGRGGAGRGGMGAPGAVPAALPGTTTCVGGCGGLGTAGGGGMPGAAEGRGAA